MLTLGAVAILLLALLAACGGGDDQADTTETADQAATATVSTPEETETPSSGASEQETSPADDPTATATQEQEAATATIESEATATSESEATATSESNADDPTATSAVSGDRLVGTASVDDDEDDVVNLLMQDPDEPMPGIDLTNVKLDGDGSQIVVTIQTAGDIAAELSDDVDVSFDVHLWQDDKPAYALSFHHNGSDDWEASVTDFSVGLGDEETIDTEISISGNTLSAAFPGSMLPDLEASFEWYSSVMLSEGGMMIGPDSWFDGAPENVIMLLADPDEFVEFPQ
jgi:hypothetical protein